MLLKRECELIRRKPRREAIDFAVGEGGEGGAPSLSLAPTRHSHLLFHYIPASAPTHRPSASLQLLTTSTPSLLSRAAPEHSCPFTAPCLDFTDPSHSLCC